MNNIKIYILTLVTSFLVLSSCKDALDVAPKNIIQSDIIFSDESAIEAYLASLYYELPVEDFRFAPNGGFNRSGTGTGGTSLAHLSDEALTTTASSDIGSGSALGYFPYSSIRNVNAFIEKIPSSPLASDKKNQWLGEAKFIRAYYYFGLVKRYGGMPLITTTQNFDGTNLGELQVPRNTEKELYDFIGKELDEAAALLRPSSPSGRANKYVAYTLKSRAMLYAASIAKYGTVELDGLVGIPASSANTYWQAAYDAAKQVIGKYSLYNKNANKSQNFADLFLDANNPEIIFVKNFKEAAGNSHSYDLFNVPYGVRAPSGYGGRISPTVELSEAYEYINDANGALKITDGSGNPIKYPDVLSLFANKDPRLAATFILPFSTWRGTTIDVQAGLINGTNTITTGDYNTKFNTPSGPIDIIGRNGIGGSGGERTQTGFYIRKYLDPGKEPSSISGTSGEQQFIDFRFAEVLLNYAEAAVELGGSAKIADAKSAINDIRARAGIQLLSDAEVTRDRIRRERQVELAFESHRYWDIRRWRIADQVLNNKNFAVLMPYRVLDDSPNTFIFKKVPSPSTKNFLPKLYYEQIPTGEIAKNPKLIQNPLY
ncbi:MAG TPA: RagB/SusD family nutrient uptake outer membrane protein [Sphingobacteriaceae bacterium]